MSDAMFKAIVLKGLPREYNNIVTLFNHGEEKDYQAVKLDLVNFVNNASGVGNNSALMSGGGNKPKCSNCKRSGHTNVDCRQTKEAGTHGEGVSIDDAEAEVWILQQDGSHR